MRVLFLDFDGVLHPLGDMSASAPDATADFRFVPLLAGVLTSHPDVRLVVHSTWRYLYAVHDLRVPLGVLGSRVVDRTPRGPRYESITWWLHANPTALSHRILDDAPREFPQPPPPELILCDSTLGLTTPGVLEALQRWLTESSGNAPKERERT